MADREDTSSLIVPTMKVSLTESRYTQIFMIILHQCATNASYPGLLSMATRRGNFGNEKFLFLTVNFTTVRNFADYG